jgi:hypothetical protein
LPGKLFRRRRREPFTDPSQASGHRRSIAKQSRGVLVGNKLSINLQSATCHKVERLKEKDVADGLPDQLPDRVSTNNMCQFVSKQRSVVLAAQSSREIAGNEDKRAKNARCQWAMNFRRLSNSNTIPQAEIFAESVEQTDERIVIQSDTPPSQSTETQ